MIEDTYRRAIIKVIDGRKNVGSSSFGNVAEKIPHRFLGVGTNVVHILLHCFKSVVVDDCDFVLEQTMKAHHIDALAWISWIPL